MSTTECSDKVGAATILKQVIPVRIVTRPLHYVFGSGYARHPMLVHEIIH